MKRMFTCFMITFTLILSTIPVASAAVNQKTILLTVVMTGNQVPVDFATYVQKNGGKVTKQLSQIGTVQVQGTASLIPILQKYTGVKSVGPTIKMNLSDTKTVIANEANAASTNSITKQHLDFFNKFQKILPYDTRNIFSITHPDPTKPPEHEPGPAEPDLYNSFQWDIKRVTHNGASFSVSKGNHDVVVGIIDSGVDTQHPDLQANFLGGKNFVPAFDNGIGQDDPNETGDPNDFEDRLGHGTHVAGTIAGNGRILGVAPETGYKVYRVFGANGSASTSTVANAIISATNDGVDVISMSLGGYSVFGQIFYTDPVTGQKYNLGNEVADFQIYKRAVKYAVDHGVTVVAAAGNEHLNATNKAEVTKYLNHEFAMDGYQFVGAGFEAPGSLPGVITVSATGPEDMIASYSNYGAGFVDVTAPGGDFQREGHGDWYEDMNFSSYKGQGYAYMAGTSMATPKVSAVAALFIAQNGKVGPKKIAQLITASAQDIGKQSIDELYGSGMVQAPFTPENLPIEVDWNKQFGGIHPESGMDAHQTKDGGYISVGNSETYNHLRGDSDIFVVKTGPDGRTEWRKNLGSDRWELGHSIMETKDGGYMVLGDSGKNEVDQKLDIYISKLSADGTVEWEKTYGKQGVYESGGSVVETADGGYLISANKVVEGSKNEIYLLKIDIKGNLLWDKFYSKQETDLFSKIIKATSDGGFIIAGTQIAGASDQSYDFYLLKIKANGEVLWEKSYGNGSNIRDRFENILETASGDFIALGTNESFEYLNPSDAFPTIKDDIYYSLIGKDGTIKWEKTIKEDGVSQALKSLVKTPDGNYLAVGFTNSQLPNLQVVKFSSTGEILLRKTYGGNKNETGFSIDNTRDGGFIVIGFTGTNAAGGTSDYDMYLLKFNRLLEK
ncbi:S8 family peptidase [Neobacillus sp. NRS-1170]|uniref:S8 family peptidase n=1 Tax=Neobacillus sp. NRS-1170 TaxID=3233898 RepID=UPI003D2BF35D